MLSLFPQLLFLAPLGYTLLRATLAILLLLGINTQWARGRTPLILAFIGLEGLAAVGLALGSFTQLAALAALIIFALWLFLSKVRPYPLSTTLLAGTIAVVLLLGGAGPFAFDLPL